MPSTMVMTSANAVTRRVERRERMDMVPPRAADAAMCSIRCIAPAHGVVHAVLLPNLHAISRGTRFSVQISGEEEGDECKGGKSRYLPSTQCDMRPLSA